MSDFNIGGLVQGAMGDLKSQDQGAAPGGAPGGGAQPGAQAQGLPPTGIQQQMQSLNSVYDQVAGMEGIGYDVRQAQFQGAGGAELGADTGGPRGSGSLDQMARDMAQRYGLPIGRGRLVDESGNFLMTPDQVAAASGGAVTQGEAAAMFNYIAQGLEREQTDQANQMSISALETGLGQVQSRGRGSLAAMQSGFYQDIAGVYQQAANRGDFEAADFSYYIQQEQQEIAMELMRRQEELAKKQGQMGALVGGGMLIGGIFSGNIGLIAGGGSMLAGGASQAGWF